VIYRYTSEFWSFVFAVLVRTFLELTILFRTRFPILDFRLLSVRLRACLAYMEDQEDHEHCWRNF
jgi:hypothetical protein